MSINMKKAQKKLYSQTCEKKQFTPTVPLSAKPLKKKYREYR